MHATRRTLLAGATLGALAAPRIASAQTPTLRITGWGGRWGELIRSDIIPPFEREHRCRVEFDQAIPFLPKLLSSPRNDPIYDVLHASPLNQWEAAAVDIIEPEVDPARVPNVRQLYPYATSDKVAGVCMFTNAIGLGYRSDRLGAAPRSWRNFWEAGYAGRRGIYIVPANTLGAAFLLWTGQVFGGDYRNLDAAFRAMEQLKPVRMVDFTGAMERLLITGEVDIAVLHDSGIYRYHGENLPLGFSAPEEGVLNLEQVLSVVKGSKMKELAYAWLNHMLSPVVQKRLAEAVWYAPANRTVELDPVRQERLATTEAKVSQLVQVDYQFYISNRARIDARFNRVFRN